LNLADIRRLAPGAIACQPANAMVTSLPARIQTELLNTKKWSTRPELSTAMFDRIEGINRRTRRRSAIGNISPMEVDRRHRQLQNVA